MHMIAIYFIVTIMSLPRYKEDGFHMLETFGQTQKLTNGFTKRHQAEIAQFKGENGCTWDAKHMSTFLNRSNFSNWSEAGCTFYSRRSSNDSEHKRYSSFGDHFFKTTKDNRNASKIGYTKVNPLVSSVHVNEINKNVIKQNLKKKSPERYAAPKSPMRVSDGKYKFEGNSVKFRVTDPLTLQHVEMKNPSNFQKERLTRLIQKRHPHGMTGVDIPDSLETEFYTNNPKQIGIQQPKIRVQPNWGRTFVLDKQWKTKGKITERYKEQYGFPKGKLIQQRKFRNDNIHGYNILTNRIRDSSGASPPQCESSLN